MKTYKTIEAAISESINTEAKHIVTITTAAGDTAYIACKVSSATLRTALNNKPMPEIKSVVGDAANLDSIRAENKKAKIRASVPGLEELDAIIEAWEEYNDKTRRINNSESYSGSRPTKPATTILETCERFPIAAAYNKAQKWNNASSIHKSSAGHRAMTRIENGEDAETVIADMEREFSDAANKYFD